MDNISINDVLLNIDSNIATITINRPEVKNAINLDICDRLLSVLNKIDNEKTVRVVILRGAGNNFISGADINDFLEELSSPEKAINYDTVVEKVTSALENISKPTIAMIKSYAIGTGLLFAIACDLRVGASNARFGIPASRFGLAISMPDMQRLVKLVGPNRARWITFTGELFDAHKALEFELINQIQEADYLEQYTYELAEMITRRSPNSLKVMKKFILKAAKNPDLYDIRSGEKEYRELYTSNDLKEGVMAYFEKRQPLF